jgi:hypothetical protein
MDEISIKVTIGSREYPLRISRANEQSVRNAERLVQERIKEFESQYPASDKYDHLAMSVMHFAGELVNLSEANTSEAQVVRDRISSIENSLSEHLATVNVH